MEDSFNDWGSIINLLNQSCIHLRSCKWTGIRLGAAHLRISMADLWWQRYQPSLLLNWRSNNNNKNSKWEFGRCCSYNSISHRENHLSDTEPHYFATTPNRIFNFIVSANISTIQSAHQRNRWYDRDLLINSSILQPWEKKYTNRYQSEVTRPSALESQ